MDVNPTSKQPTYTIPWILGIWTVWCIQAITLGAFTRNTRIAGDPLSPIAPRATRITVRPAPEPRPLVYTFSSRLPPIPRPLCNLWHNLRHAIESRYAMPRYHYVKTWRPTRPASNIMPAVALALYPASPNNVHHRTGLTTTVAITLRPWNPNRGCYRNVSMLLRLHYAAHCVIQGPEFFVSQQVTVPMIQVAKMWNFLWDCRLAISNPACWYFLVFMIASMIQWFSIQDLWKFLLLRVQAWQWFSN